MDQATKILDLCKKVGINTAFELQEYKQDHNCKSNDDTIRALTETIVRQKMLEKGKAIEEMAKILCEKCKEVKNGYDVCPYSTCDECGAMRLYEAGYRNEDEVRKQTAKAILLRVKSFLDEQTKTVKQLSKPSMGSHAIPQNCVECYEGSQDNRLDELSRIAKEFGVEVEL